MNGDGNDWAPPADEADAGGRLAELRGRLLNSIKLDSIRPLVPLIGGWLFLDSLTWISGKPGNGKSFVVLDMAGCVSEGIAWCGYPTKQGNVLYVISEGLSGIRQRVRAWEQDHGRPMSNVTWLPGPVSLVGDWASIVAIAKSIDAVLIVFDTQAMVTVGLDEVSSKDMGMIVAAAEHIRAGTGACVALVHHEAIGGDRPRGHSSMDGAAATLIRVVKDGAVVWVANTKQKDGPKHPTLSLQITAIGDSLVLVPVDATMAMAMTDSEVAVYACLRDLAALKGGASHAELKEATGSRGVPISTFGWALKRIVARGLARNEGKGRSSFYVLVDPAQGRLDSADQDGWQPQADRPADDAQWQPSGQVQPRSNASTTRGST